MMIEVLGLKREEKKGRKKKPMLTGQKLNLIRSASSSSSLSSSSLLSSSSFLVDIITVPMVTSLLLKFAFGAVNMI